MPEQAGGDCHIYNYGICRRLPQAPATDGIKSDIGRLTARTQNTEICIYQSEYFIQFTACLRHGTKPGHRDRRCRTPADTGKINPRHHRDGATGGGNVIPKRFERLTHALEGRCSIQLSYQDVIN